MHALAVYHRRPTETVVIDRTCNHNLKRCEIAMTEMSEEFEAPLEIESKDSDELDVSNKELEDHINELAEDLPEFGSSYVGELLSRLEERLEGKTYDLAYAQEYANDLLM